MRHASLILIVVFAVSAFAAEPPSSLPTRDAAIVIPLLQAFTPANTYQDVLRILGKPELDIGSASPNAIFTLTDGMRIKVRTRRMTEIKDITLHPSNRSVMEGEGKVLFEVTSKPNQALQRTLRSCHSPCCRTASAIFYASLSLRSLGIILRFL